MHYIKRKLTIPTDKSCFLFGPRQTGKSSLLRQTVEATVTINLLESETYLAFLHAPQRLREVVTQKNSVVVIDEIQRIPALLNEVHLLIEERGARFILTGSSARKLRHGGVNLLGGRARSKHLYPFIAAELGNQFSLNKALEFGGLPSIWFSASPAEDLAAYTDNYLQQEIVAEGAARNLPSFARFLQIAALSSGQILNFTQIASDAQVPRTTVHEYYGILKDTLIGCELPALKKAMSRKPVASSKFYLFDIGVVRNLQRRRGLTPKTPEYGEALEHWIFHELCTWCAVHFGHSLTYWRTTSGFEVDFVLDETIAIEVKAKEHVNHEDFRGLIAIGEELPVKRRLLVCLESAPRKVNGIEVLPVATFLRDIWQNPLTYFVT